MTTKRVATTVPGKSKAFWTGAVLAIVALFVIPPLIFLLGWNNIGNELLGWPRIDWLQAILISLVVTVVGRAFRSPK